DNEMLIERAKQAVFTAQQNVNALEREYAGLVQEAKDIDEAFKSQIEDRQRDLQQSDNQEKTALMEIDAYMASITAKLHDEQQAAREVTDQFNAQALALRNQEYALHEKQRTEESVWSAADEQ